MSSDKSGFILVRLLNNYNKKIFLNYNSQML